MYVYYQTSFIWTYKVDSQPRILKILLSQANKLNKISINSYTEF